jgi:NSS family neurotransmitter:Na+ symporter
VGNLFTAIPVIFQKIPGGEAWVIVFYALVAFAALTSTISLLEVVVAYFIDQKGWSRRKAVTTMGGLIFALGIPSALSFNIGKDFTIAGRTFFDVMDYLCANWALPVGGLFITLFTGWVLTRREKAEEIEGRPRVLALWDFLVRYVAPVAVIAVIVGIVFGLGGEG